MVRGDFCIQELRKLYENVIKFDWILYMMFEGTDCMYH